MPPSTRSAASGTPSSRERVRQVARLERHRLERGTHDVRAAAVAREADQRGARVRIPPRRAESRERGDAVHAVGRGDARRDERTLVRVLDQAELVAQPLHHGARVEDAPLQRVRHAPREPERDGTEQPVARDARGVARVHENEASRAVGRLGFARVHAVLAHRACLLIADEGAHPDRRAEHVRRRRAEIVSAVAHLGQDGHRDVEQDAELLVPLLAVDVEQQGARGVRRVGRVHLAAGQLP